MRVRVLLPFLYAADGIRSLEVQPGETHDLAPFLVKGLREIGAVIPLEDLPQEGTAAAAGTGTPDPVPAPPTEEEESAEEDAPEDAPTEGTSGASEEGASETPAHGKPRSGKKDKHRRR